MGGDRRHWQWAGAILAGLLAVGFLVQFVWIRPAAVKAPLPTASPNVGQMIVVATARIAAESRRELPPPLVEAAPMEGSGADTARTRPELRPTPPEGYAFVDHFGEMAKTRIEGRTIDSRQAESGPDWLDSPDAIAALTRQAAAAGRDWSFGWIRLAGDARRTDLARALADNGRRDRRLLGATRPGAAPRRRHPSPGDRDPR